MKLFASALATASAIQSENLCPSYNDAGGCYVQEGLWKQDGSAGAIRCNMVNSECLKVNCEFDRLQAEFRHDLFDNNPDQQDFLDQIENGTKELLGLDGQPLGGDCGFTVGTGTFTGKSLNIDWSYEDCSHLMTVRLENEEVVYSVTLTVSGEDGDGDDRIEFYVDHRFGATCNYPASITIDNNFWVNQEDVEASQSATGKLADEFTCDFYSNEERTSRIDSHNIVNMGDTIWGQVTSKALPGLSYELTQVTVSDAVDPALSFNVIENAAPVNTVRSSVDNEQFTGNKLNFDWMSFGFQGKSDQNQLKIQCNVELTLDTVPRCPEGWIEKELSDGVKCLQVNGGKFKWQTAVSRCLAADALLGRPKNEPDNRIFADLIGYNKYDLWLGAHLADPNQPGYFVDPIDGTDVEWTNWLPKEPNFRYEKERFVHMVLTDGNQYGSPGNYRGGQRNGKWNDVRSFNRADEPDERTPQWQENNAFICVKEPQS